jgi:hypothetical protein
VGLILAADDYMRVQNRIGEYVPRIAADFSASAPPLDRPPA